MSGRSGSGRAAKNDVAVLLLAAGRGTRFGPQPKLLAPFRGEPLVRHAAKAAVASGLRPIVAVTGHAGDALAGVLSDLPIAVLRNPDPGAGLAGSLRLGFAALVSQARAVAVCLGDMPLVSGALLDSLAAAWREAGCPAALVPTFGGRRGNPVVLSASLADEIAGLSGDAGAGALLRSRADVVAWPCPSDAVLRDVDTPAALARL